MGSSTTQNISLEGSASFYLRVYSIDIHDCPDFEIYWEIQRNDGVRELYTVVNETYHSERLELPDRGVNFYGYCRYGIVCDADITISPTDMRYNGAVITGIFDLPECFNSPNFTDSLTINIQGIVIHKKFYTPYITFHLNKIMTTKSTAGFQKTIY